MGKNFPQRVPDVGDRPHCQPENLLPLNKLQIIFHSALVCFLRFAKSGCELQIIWRDWRDREVVVILYSGRG
jgi:hypothetical protein